VERVIKGGRGVRRVNREERCGRDCYEEEGGQKMKE
jgi:hypothetical protein